MYEHHDAQDDKEGDKGKYHRSASTSPFAVIIASNQGEDKFAENYDCSGFVHAADQQGAAGVLSG
jgi:hypothetical protein